MASSSKKRVGIYVHVPFCLSKCHYCDFCSVQHTDEETREQYTEQVCREIGHFSSLIGDKGDIPVADSVYFGGGTPTLLSAKQIARILGTVNTCFGIDGDAEITVETNPKTADAEKLGELRSVGVNRLSIGMQSIHDSELRALGRIHSSADFLKTYEDARRVGFDNLSVDLMYGIPNQTKESFAMSVKSLAMLKPEHISSYCLTVEEGTNFHRRRDSLALPDEDTVSDMYGEMGEILSRFGYEKYEISNFSKKGRESRHNLKYWRCEDYLGFGVAAHSYFEGVRFAHSRDLDAYLNGQSIIIEVERIGAEEAMNEFVLLGMRLSRGVDLAEFSARFGRDFCECFPAFAKYSPEFVQLDGERCRFTDKGMFVSSYILSEALSFGEET